MLSLTPWNQNGTSYSTRRIWYVCHVEKMSLMFLNTDACNLSYPHSPTTHPSTTPEDDNEDGGAIVATLLAACAASLRQGRCHLCHSRHRPTTRSTEDDNKDGGLRFLLA
jgi:hypothetical protein